MKTFGKITSYVLVAIVAFLIFANGWLFLQMKYTPSKVPELFGYKILNIISASMEPAIEVGQSILIKETKNIKVGDVITFRQDNALITHRVVNIEGDKYFTKGDANNVEDLTTHTIADIEGKVVMVLPGMRKLGLFLKTREGIMSIIILPIFLIGIGICIQELLKKGGTSNE